jgi:hypothetical protein
MKARDTSAQTARIPLFKDEAVSGERSDLSITSLYHLFHMFRYRVLFL